MFKPINESISQSIKIKFYICGNFFCLLRSKVEQSAIPDESNTEGKEKKDEQKLGAPEDIFKAKSKLGELK